MDLNEKSRIAYDPDTSPETLRTLYLSDGYGYWVPSGLARNPNTPSDILDALAGCREQDIVHAVARNRNTPSTTLARLGKRKRESVLILVAYHPSTPPKVLSRLANSDSHAVRCSVAGNPSATPDVLLDLAMLPERHRSKTFLWNLLRNHNLPFGIWVKSTHISTMRSLP